MTIRHIVATDSKWGIAKNGETPWHLPGELAHMRKTIERFGGIVLVGSKTWEIMEQNARARNPDELSFGDRHVHVLSSQNLSLPAGVTLVHKVEEFVAERRERNQDFWVASGTLYEQIPPDIVYRTLIDANFDCDRFYDMPDKFVCAGFNRPIRENDLTYCYEIWSRRQN